MNRSNKKPRFANFIKSGLTVLISVLIIWTVVEAAGRAVPYSPGETLDPTDCSPGETNCTVSGPITSFGPTGQLQTGTTQYLATSSDTNIGLTITSSGDVHTLTSQWLGTLDVSRGGTGLTSATAGYALIGNSATALQGNFNFVCQFCWQRRHRE